MSKNKKLCLLLLAIVVISLHASENETCKATQEPTTTAQIINNVKSFIKGASRSIGGMVIGHSIVLSAIGAGLISDRNQELLSAIAGGALGTVFDHYCLGGKNDDHAIARKCGNLAPLILMGAINTNMYRGRMRDVCSRDERKIAQEKGVWDLANNGWTSIEKKWEEDINGSAGACPKHGASCSYVREVLLDYGKETIAEEPKKDLLALYKRLYESRHDYFGWRYFSRCWGRYYDDTLETEIRLALTNRGIIRGFDHCNEIAQVLLTPYQSIRALYKHSVIQKLLTDDKKG